MIGATPAPLAREQLIFARYTDILAQLIAEETPADLLRRARHTPLGDRTTSSLGSLMSL